MKNRSGIFKVISGIARIIFSRVVLFALLILLQIYWFVLLADRVYEQLPFLDSLFTALSFIVIITIINRRWNPIFKLTWIIPIMIFPVVGILAYIFVEMQLGSRIIKKSITTITDKSKRYLLQDDELLRRLTIEDPNVANLARYMNEYACAPIYKNTVVKYFPSGEDMFPYLMAELDKAENFIFMEYFILEEGKVWNKVLDLLEQKVKEGVEVRVMYDGMCSLFQLPPGYFKKLRKKGIRSKAFSRMIPLVSTTQNNRDHRKIVVIDNKTAFTGGINLSDEYVNIKRRFGYWKDTGVMLKGDAVKSFTLMFLQMWNIDEKIVPNFDKYINLDYEAPDNNSGYVIGFGDSPFDDEQVGENVYMDILNTAKHYVDIITPYLILDNEMLQTLKFTAKRGVEVTIIMPGIPDKKYAYCLGRTYYRELIEAGVKIYEYTPGFTHAKMFISDDEKAVVGTINLDFRSLYLHFECAAYIYKNPEIAAIENDYKETLKECTNITVLECKNRPLYYKIAGQILRVFAPLM